MILQLVGNEVQDLDSPFIKAIDMIPEWEEMYHSIVTEQQRFAVSRFVVPEKMATDTKIEADECVPQTTKTEPM